MKGMSCYPETFAIDIIMHNLENSKTKESFNLNTLISDGASDKFIINNYKQAILGEGNFIVGGNLAEKVEKKISKIKSNEFPREEYILYNPIEIYNLANELRFVSTSKAFEENKAEYSRLLNNELNSLSQRGANLEEVKKYILFDNLVYANKLNEGYYEREFVEQKVNSALRTVNTLSKFDKYSPYSNLFVKLYQATLQEDPLAYKADDKLAKREMVDFDSAMLKAYSLNKALCMIMKTLFVLRTYTKANENLDKISHVQTYKNDIYSTDIAVRIFNEEALSYISDISSREKKLSIKDIINFYVFISKTLKEISPESDILKSIDLFSTTITMHEASSRLSTFNNYINFKDKDENEL